MSDFVQVAAGALADQVDRVMLFRVAAQNQNAHIGRLGADHGQRVNAALARHRQVHDQDVQLHIAHQINRLAPAGRLADHAQIDVVGEKLFQPRTHNGMVINNSNFDHVSVSFSFCKTSMPCKAIKQSRHAEQPPFVCSVHY